MKKIKYSVFSILVIITAFSLSFSANANELKSLDIEDKCSISMALIPNGFENDAVKGAEVTIYRVADLAIENGKVVYKYCSDFSGCGYDLDNPENSRLAWSVYTYAIENRIRGKSLITDSKGEVVFKDLEPGLYLGAETMSVKNYCDFSPFLLSLPMAENDRWIYNVSAAPKIEIERYIEINVNKVWNDNGKVRPENIQVQLVSDEGVYDTVTLSQENNWSYTWEYVPFVASWAVKEVNVPYGYKVAYDRNGFNFVISNTGDDDIIVTTGTGVSTGTGTNIITSKTTAGVSTDINTTAVSSTVTTSSSMLIQTGQLKWPIPVLICCGIALIAVGITVTGSGGKNENK